MTHRFQKYQMEDLWRFYALEHLNYYNTFPSPRFKN